MTHILPFSVQVSNGQARAICGLWVEPVTETGTVATCPECQRLDAAYHGRELEPEAVMLKHFSDEPRRRGRSRTVCGKLVDFDELHPHSPTCSDCVSFLNPTQTATELFGDGTEARPVHTTLPDALVGYTPKGATR